MRWSRSFIPTLREAPAGLAHPGRGLLHRAGFVRGAALLPLGLRTVRKLEALLRDELALAGALELRASGADLLGPVRSDLQSYRQVPLLLARLEDALALDLDERGLARSTQALSEAYGRVCARASLPVRNVDADGGPAFFAPAAAGEDSFLGCPRCSYAADRETAEGPPPRHDATSGDTRQILPLQEVPTPGASTIEQVAQALQVSPRLLVKTLIVRTPDAFAAVLVRGDHEVALAKLRRALGAGSIRLATPEEILLETGGPVGFSGPVGLKMRTLADHAVVPLSNFVVGANRADAHYMNVNLNRDFRPAQVADLRVALEGDPCPRCGAALAIVRGTELGGIRRLGPTGIELDDEQGRRRPLLRVAGTLSLEALLTALAERHRDPAGLVWPKALAPFAVELVSLDASNLQVVETAHTVYDGLRKAGVEVLWDDRDAAPGVKFADADLLGLPVRITLGKRALESGAAEFRARRNKVATNVPIERITETLTHELEGIDP